MSFTQKRKYTSPTIFMMTTLDTFNLTGFNLETSAKGNTDELIIQNCQ